MAVFLKNMKYWNVVLQEVFLIPPALLEKQGVRPPSTRDELVTLSGLGSDDVDRVLRKIDALQELPVEISRDQLPPDAILLDVRQRGETVSVTSGSILNGPRKTYVLHEWNFERLLPVLQHSHVVVLGRDPAHAWSAAMYLREHGCPCVFSLLDPALE